MTIRWRTLSLAMAFGVFGGTATGGATPFTLEGVVCRDDAMRFDLAERGKEKCEIPLPGARIRVWIAGAERSATTDDDGHFKLGLPDIPRPGDSFEAMAAGYDGFRDPQFGMDGAIGPGKIVRIGLSPAICKRMVASRITGWMLGGAGGIGALVTFGGLIYWKRRRRHREGDLTA